MKVRIEFDTNVILEKNVRSVVEGYFRGALSWPEAPARLGITIPEWERLFGRIFASVRPSKVAGKFALDKDTIDLRRQEQIHAKDHYVPFFR